MVLFAISPKAGLWVINEKYKHWIQGCYTVVYVISQNRLYLFHWNFSEMSRITTQIHVKNRKVQYFWTVYLTGKALFLKTFINKFRFLVLFIGKFFKSVECATNKKTLYFRHFSALVRKSVDDKELWNVQHSSNLLNISRYSWIQDYIMT